MSPQSHCELLDSSTGPHCTPGLQVCLGLLLRLRSSRTSEVSSYISTHERGCGKHKFPSVATLLAMSRYTRT